MLILLHLGTYLYYLSRKAHTFSDDIDFANTIQNAMQQQLKSCLIDQL